MHGPRHGPLGRNIFTSISIMLTRARMVISGPTRTWAAQRSTTGSDPDNRSSGCCAIMAVGTVSSQRFFAARQRAAANRVWARHLTGPGWVSELQLWPFRYLQI